VERVSKRSSLLVMADILRIKGTKIALMYGANLSHSQTQKYLDFMVTHQLIEPEEGSAGSSRCKYRPTEKGLKLLSLIEKLELISQ